MVQHCQQSAEIMKQSLHRRLRAKPLFGLRPLSVSLFLSLVVVLHSVSSLAKSFDEEVDSQNDNATHRGSEGLPSGQGNPKCSSCCPNLKEIFAKREGIIKYPRAGYYKEDLLCKWRINAPADKVIELQVKSIDVDCSDRLSLYDGRKESPSSRMVALCGKVAPSAPFTTKSNVALIRFESDDDDEGKGFVLIYRVISKPGLECGIPDVQPKVDSRIVGGVEATPHSWPWQVSIQWLDKGKWKKHCGGSVLYPHWVITAAHCVFRGGKADYKIVLGEHNIAKKEGTEQEFKMKERLIHEYYDCDTGVNDIALIRLPEDVEFNRYIRPICLPDDDKDDVKDGTRCVATGWGVTQSTGDENVLNQVYLPVINNSQCNKPDWRDGRITDNMICAGYPEGVKSSCRGDSGGPLVSFSEGKWKLFGITIGFGECAQPRRPGVYTRVANYLKWIQKKTEQYE